MNECRGIKPSDLLVHDIYAGRGADNKVSVETVTVK
jgi:hypothetical protein